MKQKKIILTTVENPSIRDELTENDFRMILYILRGRNKKLYLKVKDVMQVVIQENITWEDIKQ